MEELYRRNLLALHYVFPAPLHQIFPLIKLTANLSKCNEITPNMISTICHVSSARASNILSLWKKYQIVPLEDMYQAHQITPILFTDPLYPKSLLSLYDPPAVVYIRGNSEILKNKKKVAIIGSRKATSYSSESMKLLLPPLIKNDYIIVSGLAKGADTMAHRTTIELSGQTIAVLGAGFQHIYPKENTELARIMSTHHLLLTEYPPYVSPKKWNFPKRNRIISGLSQGVVITEAELKSGTVSTMEHALENGKEIFAVPGPIFSPLSLGPNHLILEGAKPIWDGNQILEELENIK